MSSSPSKLLSAVSNDVAAVLHTADAVQIEQFYGLMQQFSEYSKCLVLSKTLSNPKQAKDDVKHLCGSVLFDSSEFGKTSSRLARRLPGLIADISVMHDLYLEVEARFISNSTAAEESNQESADSAVQDLASRDGSETPMNLPEFEIPAKPKRLSKSERRNAGWTEVGSTKARQQEDDEALDEVGSLKSFSSSASKSYRAGPPVPFIERVRKAEKRGGYGAMVHVSNGQLCISAVGELCCALCKGLPRFTVKRQGLNMNYLVDHLKSPGHMKQVRIKRAKDREAAEKLKKEQLQTDGALQQQQPIAGLTSNNGSQPAKVQRK